MSFSSLGYLANPAECGIEAANGHQGNPIEGDASVTADFDNFDLSVDAYEEAGTIVFCVTGSVDVHYEFSEYVQKGRSDEYDHKQWGKMSAKTTRCTITSQPKSL